ncbi:rhomboid family protein [Alkalibacillus almallahensis]|uniref:rhomboid family protein n=1 Tax=Alkalibacillus almallahensis TaxID=1379154 RepID=UPI001422BB67|nr:rhomboid family intramembrane serine protease [Alkalibacillus almallahensis]
MYIRERYRMLKLIDQLVNNQFEVRFVSEYRDFVVLEKYEKRQSYIVAVAHQLFDWSNHLQRDVNQKINYLNKNARLFRGRKQHYHIVYVADLPPVDDWESAITSEQTNDSNHQTTSIYYLHENAISQELNRLFNNLHTKIDETIVTSEFEEEDLDRQVVYLEQKIIGYHKAKEREFNRVFFYGKTKLTYLLVMLNLLVFAFVEMNGTSTNTAHLIDWGAKYNPAIADGEWWRIGSSMFLHIGAFHLFMNMLALYFLGEVTEKIYGTKRFLFVYSLAGLFGGVASFATNDAVAAGASGAIFGLFGALLFFGLNYRELFFKTIGTNLLFIVGLNIALGFVVPQIDNGAHLGGLIGGFLAAQIVQLPYKRQLLRAIVSFVLFIGLLIGMSFYGYSNAKQPENPQALALLAQQQIEQENYQETIDLLTTSVNENIDHEYVYFYRAIAYLETEQYDQAESDLKESIEINPDLGEAHYNLAVLYRQTGEDQKAIEYAEKAAELKPDHEQFQKFYDELTE